MNKNIIDRVIRESEYMIKTNDTVRDIAKVFNASVEEIFSFEENE